MGRIGNYTGSILIITKTPRANRPGKFRLSRKEKKKYKKGYFALWKGRYEWSCGLLNQADVNFWRDGGLILPY